MTTSVEFKQYKSFTELFTATELVHFYVCKKDSESDELSELYQKLRDLGWSAEEKQWYPGFIWYVIRKENYEAHLLFEEMAGVELYAVESIAKELRFLEIESSFGATSN